MSLLHLDAIAVRSLAAIIDSKTMFLRAARFEREADDDGEMRDVLFCTLQSGGELPFASL